MKKRVKKQLLPLLLSLVLSLSVSATAFAAEASDLPESAETEVAVETESVETEVATESVSESEDISAVSARSASGYAADYTDYTTDSFYINVTGSSSSSGTAKLKAWDFPSTAQVYVSLYRPDGSTAFSSVQLPIGTEITKTFSNFPTGNYRLSYTVYGVDKGWIYCNLNG